MLKVLIGGFIIGALAMLAFHQGTTHILHNYAARVPGLVDAIGHVEGPGWNLRRGIASPTAPGLFVPVFAVLAFWGGLWGILLGAIIRWTRLPDLLTSTLVSAAGGLLIGITAGAWLEGIPDISPEDPRAMMREGLLFAAYGFGAAFLMRPLMLRRPPSTRR